MKRKPLFFCILGAISIAVCSTAPAQQQRKIPHVGYLTISSLSSNVARNEAFRRGMQELGYVEGKNIVLEWRSGDGKVERKNELVAEVVRHKVDVIVTSGPTMTRAAKQATATIPIVMAFDPDPVSNGFIAGLARPGGNITGLSSLSPELSGNNWSFSRRLFRGSPA
jgi:putative tryptophan/tyrosine transport system substrate-binding protein